MRDDQARKIPAGSMRDAAREQVDDAKDPAHQGETPPTDGSASAAGGCAPIATVASAPREADRTQSIRLCTVQLQQTLFQQLPDQRL